MSYELTTFNDYRLTVNEDENENENENENEDGLRMLSTKL